MLGSAGRTAANALAAADRFGYPVVLKGTSPAVKHKSELSLVALSIADAESLRRAWTQMTDKVGRLDPAVAQDVEMIVQPMAGRGIEIILGARHEPGFGTLVTVGLGGIFVEILNSASSRIGPVDESQALRMLDECGALAICKACADALRATSLLPFQQSSASAASHATWQDGIALTGALPM